MMLRDSCLLFWAILYI